jgi:predicted dehydrogenase
VGEKTKHPVHDHFVALLHASNQAIGVIELSWLAKKFEVMFDLISSNGKQIQILNYNYLSEIPEKLPKSFLQGFYWDQKVITKKWVKSVLNNLHYRHVLACLPHYILFNKYINAIKNDLEPPVTPENGRKTIELLECIEESLNKNKPVNMKKIAH